MPRHPRAPRDGGRASCTAWAVAGSPRGGPRVAGGVTCTQPTHSAPPPRASRDCGAGPVEEAPRLLGHAAAACGCAPHPRALLGGRPANHSGSRWHVRICERRHVRHASMACVQNAAPRVATLAPRLHLHCSILVELDRVGEGARAPYGAPLAVARPSACPNRHSSLALPPRRDHVRRGLRNASASTVSRTARRRASERVKANRTGGAAFGQSSRAGGPLPPARTPRHHVHGEAWRQVWRVGEVHPHSTMW